MNSNATINVAEPLVADRANRSRNNGVDFAIATSADDPEIRQLLRSNPMGGQISISLEREPDYFRDANLPDERKQTIVARKSGRPVCVGNCTTRLRYINGEPRCVGYLAGLRLDAGASGRFDIVRRGYEFFREIQADSPADFYFTSIAADNLRARKFLEGNVRGMPRYEPIGDFVTLLLPTQKAFVERGRPAQVEALTASDISEIASQLNQQSREYQLSPHWTENQLRALTALGLPANAFAQLTNSEMPVFAALWDQRDFKQTVIRGYTPFLKWSRPLLNLTAGLGGWSNLPPVGATLRNAFVSHVACAPSQTGDLLSVIAHFASIAVGNGIEFLTLGFAVDDPRFAAVRRQFRCREYHSRVYTVSWPGIGSSAEFLDRRCLAPEVALL